MSCDPASDAPFLQNEGCVEQCQIGKTPISTNNFSECVNCDADCATCKDGSPGYCLSCADGDKQFRYGGQCLPDCPDGTTRDLESSICIGCR